MTKPRYKKKDMRKVRVVKVGRAKIRVKSMAQARYRVEQEAVLEKLMAKLAEYVTWKTASGRKIAVSKMTDSHISNALLHMQNTARIFVDGMIGPDAMSLKKRAKVMAAIDHLYGQVYEVMEWERKRRVQRMEQKQPKRTATSCVPEAWRAFMKDRHDFMKNRIEEEFLSRSERDY